MKNLLKEIGLSPVEWFWVFVVAKSATTLNIYFFEVWVFPYLDKILGAKGSTIEIKVMFFVCFMFFVPMCIVFIKYFKKKLLYKSWSLLKLWNTVLTISAILWLVLAVFITDYNWLQLRTFLVEGILGLLFLLLLFKVQK